jgi:chromosome segregation ATPase
VLADKTYTQAEHDAVLTAAVERETAALRQQVADLQADNDQKANRLDTVEAEKAAAESRATTAETSLETFKSEIEAEKAATQRRDARATEMREVAASLGDDWFTDERKDRWARMSDEDFASQKGEIAEIASKVSTTPGKSPEPKGDLPKETAAETSGGNTEAAKPRAATVLGMSRGRKVA